MNGGDLAGLRRQSEGFGRDLENPRGVAEIEPRFDTVISGFEHRNTVMGAQRCDAFSRPAIAMAGDEAVSVEDARDDIVIGDQHELTDRSNDVGRSAVALPAPPSWDVFLAI